MAFLGDVGKFFNKAVRNPAVQVVFPVAAVGSLLASKVGHDVILKAGHALATLEGGASHAGVATDQHLTGFQPYYTTVPYQPYPGGGYPSWDYSTPSLGFSTPPPGWDPTFYQGGSTYSGPAWGVGPFNL